MKEQIATRDAYGKKLVELGEIDSQVVVLDSDLSCSTKTINFAKKFPERFFNAGVAEQDMMGMAAGLAASGKTVFCSTFAMFAAGRAWEPFRNSIAYPHFNVKVCASHAGLTVGEDGASHQIIEDLSLMRVIPGVKVFVPADGIETQQIIQAVYEDKGPCYVRLGRAKCPVIFDNQFKFQIGKGQVLVEGKDICVFACGFMTHIALEAAQLLKDKGYSVSVVNLASIKPIDSELIVKMASLHQHLVSVEEHSIIGGLGSAISEVLSDFYPFRLIRLGVKDEFGQSGKYQEVLTHYQLDSFGVAQSILSQLKANK